MEKPEKPEILSKIFVNVIQDSSEKLLIFDIKADAFIKNIKEEIQEKMKIPCNSQRIFFNKDLLQDFKSFKDYGIQSDSTLYIVPKFKEEKHTSISINSFDGKIINLLVKKKSDIENLKLQIQERLEIFPHKQNLMFDNKILEDEKFLCDYNIRKHDILQLELKKTVFQIFVMTFTGKIITIEIEPRETIRKLKEMIREKEGIPEEKQRLVFSNKELLDHFTLFNYKIKRDSNLQLYLKNRYILCPDKYINEQNDLIQKAKKKKKRRKQDL